MVLNTGPLDWEFSTLTTRPLLLMLIYLHLVAYSRIPLAYVHPCHAPVYQRKFSLSTSGFQRKTGTEVYEGPKRLHDYSREIKTA